LSTFNASAFAITAGVSMAGHIYDINAVVRINANQIVTASSDSTIKVWNIDTGAMVNQYYSHSCFVLSAVLLPSGMLATGGCDGSVRLWNLTSGIVSVLPNTLGKSYYGLKLNPFFGPNGALVVGSSYTSTLSFLAFYDAMNLTRFKLANTNYSVYDIEIVPPNGHVAVGGVSYLNVFNITGGLVSSIGFNGSISRLRILPDNVTLVCGMQNVSIVLFNVKTNTLGATYMGGYGEIPWGVPVNMLEVTPDQLYLVSGGADQIMFWQWTTMSLTLVNALNGSGSIGIYNFLWAGIIIAPNYTASKRKFIRYSIK
jgi:WD40 repeat protein